MTDAWSSRPASPWRTLATTAIGTSHERADQECQDAAAVRTIPAGVVLVVADGAGTAPRGGEGADLAVAAALRQVEAHPFQSWLTQADVLADVRAVFAGAVHEFQAEVARQGDGRDFACTLGIVILRDAWVAVGSVGDSFVVVATTDHVALLEPVTERGTFANEVRLLTGADHLEPRTTACWDPTIASVVLSTDGLEKLIKYRVIERTGVRHHVPVGVPTLFFRGMTNAVRDGASAEVLRRALMDDNIRRRKGDDIGVAIATR